MTSTMRGRREELEDRLRKEMAQAEEELTRAAPESLSDALLRYQDTLYRFSRLVIDGELPVDHLNKSVGEP